ncbi:MAG: N-acetyltransferase [Dysgonamonadaceae bacterium]|jgi:predicted GNAT family acetyltransferase|nr:N-acetyltransferase [Dysgonamonadaceae bacterium]
MTISIAHKDNTHGGYFKATDENGVKLGEMTYGWAGDDKIIIDHTGVESPYEGLGVGKQMVMKAVEFARSANIKIVPLCPFATAMFNRHPDINDVRY